MTGYKISTLADMAAIPLEARGRFLAELPAILDHLSELAGAKRDIDASGVVMLLVGDPVWVDDAKGEIRTTVVPPKRWGLPSIRGTKKIGTPTHD